MTSGFELFSRKTLAALTTMRDSSAVVVTSIAPPTPILRALAAGAVDCGCVFRGVAEGRRSGEGDGSIRSGEVPPGKGPKASTTTQLAQSFASASAAKPITRKIAETALSLLIRMFPSGVT
jgi:hypothetical protein